ncbi:hypothetical protein ETAA8_34510 [Anatilimnocola aggregata]|uniref:Uncharacterized protein n=2 Tax=Anatilimnocola aggregata TaxID=2528021 RepID=A0A517YDP2_9BACT|nr:hypothetical protein ETAA8_34510 [Anatilimnocola aggregata]
MTIKQDIALELQRLAPSGGELEVRTATGRIVSQLDVVDAVGCSFTCFDYQSTNLAAATVDSLKALSNKIQQRLTYLMEPISLLETDTESVSIQMRSSPPQVGDDGRSYYELLVRRGGEVTLRRYHKAAGQPRQIVPAHVTREVLGRLAEDFVAVIG